MPRLHFRARGRPVAIFIRTGRWTGPSKWPRAAKTPGSEPCPHENYGHSRAHSFSPRAPLRINANRGHSTRPEAPLNSRFADPCADAGATSNGAVHTHAGPNLFIIGASKAGSSALHAYLDAHPDICMSSEKEPCYFVDQTVLRSAWPIMARRPCSHDWQAYLSLWRGGEGARYRGEGSVYYSQTPHRGNVAARIAAACPDARIIYTVREPVTRAIGHYWQRFKEFQEPLPPEEAVRENALYRDTSDYALQLQAYLDHFPPSQIHVIVAEELRTNRREVMARCIEWLGLTPFEYDDARLADRHRSPPTSRKPRLPLVGKVRDSRLWSVARNHLPAGLVTRLRQASTHTFDKSEIDEDAARAWLSDHLAPRRAAFEAMIGQPVTAWDNA
ncbi:sulfotransferase family protein [Novosphingobium album (ex Hu et al. 2023)]|uniref:Sulfotransferase domain-containing protein n=1 Tax=Novosphingobium album (ex Hu et al. 2023) TaxID=2930093 RepID=A0ABT0B5C5_9SPHN|nr:sulfotransferase [Novosphingobium album (ex Hu et al. 2023)]MCJ2180014.1 sulfotransferase domain-containing protein [Novosphingobium album (ex Hu et al. 2023)]